MDAKTLAMLEEYCKKGFKLFPISKKTKRPAILNNLVEATDDINKIKEWSKKFPSCNWGLSLARSGLVCVDIDENHDGLKKWNELIFENGEPETLIQQSGSGKGLHYVFKAKPNAKYKGKVDRKRGLDCKHNGYIVIAPSIHERTKNEYKWKNNLEPAEVPEWLENLILKIQKEKKSDFDRKALPPGFYQEIVAELKEKTFGYEEWVGLGMALHSAFEGSEEGLKYYTELSCGVNFQEGDIEKAEEKWNSFTLKDDGIGPASFIHIAKTLGCNIPTSLEEDKELFRLEMLRQKEKDLSKDPKWFVDKVNREYTLNLDFLMKEINGQGYAVLSGENEGKIIKYWTEPSGVRKVKMIPNEDFRTSLKHKYFKVWERNASGVFVPKLKFATDVWLSSNQKQTFRKVVFRAKSDPQDLNLFTGIPCEKVVYNKENLKPYFDFIRDIICLGNVERFNYLLDWTAFKFQKPHVKCSVVPVLIGDQGVGKGLFVRQFELILKEYFTKINSSRMLKERFNTEQAQKLMIFLDEASWSGDKEEAGILKDLTANPTMTVEEKFGARRTIENPAGYIVASNNIQAVNVELSNRRFLIFNVSDEKLSDPGYYSELWALLEDETFVKELYSYYLERDVSKFKPNAFPHMIDNQGFESRLKSLGAVAEFWNDVLFENPIGIFHRGSYFKRNEIYELFVDFVEKTRHWQRSTTPHSFWRQTAKLFPLIERAKTVKKRESSTREIAVSVPPLDFVNAFCTQMKIALPQSFCELDLLVDSDFEPIETQTPAIETKRPVSFSTPKMEFAKGP